LFQILFEILLLNLVADLSLETTSIDLNGPTFALHKGHVLFHIVAIPETKLHNASPG